MRYYPRHQELPPKAPRYPGWAKSSTEHTALITRVASCVSVDGTHVKGFWVHTTLIDRPVETFDSHRKLPAPQLYRLTGIGSCRPRYPATPDEPSRPPCAHHWSRGWHLVSVDGTHVKGFWLNTTFSDRTAEPFDSHPKLPASQVYRSTGSGQRIQAISFTCIDDHIPRGNVFRSVVVLLEVFWLDFYSFFPIQFLFVSYSMATTPCRFETCLNICWDRGSHCVGLYL